MNALYCSIVVLFFLGCTSVRSTTHVTGPHTTAFGRAWSVVRKDLSKPPNILEVIELPQLGNWQFPELWPAQNNNNNNNNNELASPQIGLINDSGPAEEPCQWEGTAYCSDEQEPICVTDFNCIYTLRNRCMLRKLNCACKRYHILQSKFCGDFKTPNYRRCNVKVYLE